MKDYIGVLTRWNTRNVTRATVAKVNEVRGTVSNSSPPEFQGHFRVATTPTVCVSVLFAKERWPGWPQAHVVALGLIDSVRDTGVADARTACAISLLTSMLVERYAYLPCVAASSAKQ